MKIFDRSFFSHDDSRRFIAEHSKSCQRQSERTTRDRRINSKHENRPKLFRVKSHFATAIAAYPSSRESWGGDGGGGDKRQWQRIWMETFPHSEWKEKKENLAIKKSQFEKWVECDDDDEDTAEYNREREKRSEISSSRNRGFWARALWAQRTGEKFNLPDKADDNDELWRHRVWLNNKQPPTSLYQDAFCKFSFQFVVSCWASWGERMDEGNFLSFFSDSLSFHWINFLWEIFLLIYSLQLFSFFLCEFEHTNILFMI